jgi:hypothetical protein
MIKDYEFPDKEAEESALVGYLDIQSTMRLNECIDMLYKWLKYREDNYLHMSNKESFLKVYLLYLNDINSLYISQK